MKSDRLFLIDATAFCYRAFYGLRNLATSFGQPTNAVYGFTTILKKILNDYQPAYLAACFDVSRDTFRQKKFAAYKIQRPEMPDGLKSQIAYIKDIIRAYGINIFEKEGYEADDIIASLARLSREHKVPVTIVSSDKDMLQLVDENTLVLSPYEEEGIIYDSQKVCERFGVDPERIPDVIGLMGDATDNIPGVRGVGEKTALKLLREFGSIDGLFRQVEKVNPDKIRSAIKENIQSIRLSKDLAIADRNIDLDFNIEALRRKEPDCQALFRLFKHLEFKRLLKGLPEQEESGVKEEKRSFSDAQAKEALKGVDEIYLYGSGLEDLTLAGGKEIFSFKEAGTLAPSLLADVSVKKSGFDLKKIKASLARQGIDLEGLKFDLMIAAYLLNPAKSGYSVNELAWDYLNQQLGSTSAKAALEIFIKARPLLEKELAEKELLKLFQDVEMPLVEVLAQMEATGIRLDVKFLEALSRELESRLAGIIEDIYGLSGCQFNINSPKQLREVLFERLKLPVSKKTKTGPSTDEEVLNNLASRHKLPALLLEYRQLTKLKNTYIDTLPRMVDSRSGRIHASFNQTGTQTGRLSSSDPNLQNIPIKTQVGAKIRQAIIAFDERSFIVSFDYSQIELRILAHLSQDENLIAAFKEGKDIHSITAGLIYGAPEEDVEETMRESAKRINFGIIYGLSPYGLARDLGISVGEAQVFIEAYFTRYPRVKEYSSEQISRARSQGYVTTILGRRRYLPEINNKNQGIREFAQRQATNTPIQGSASDLIKSAMVSIYSRMREKKYGSRMIIQIHDELVFNVPEKELPELTALVKQRMENVLELSVPIKVSVKKGRNWHQMEPV